MISDEAVEAAARVLCRKAHIDKYGTDAWRDGELDTRLDQYWPCWSTEARAALEAALPHLLASQGCGTGHSGEQLEPAVGATAALAPKPAGWRYEFSAPRQENGYRDGSFIWHVGYAAEPPIYPVRNLTPLYELGGSNA